MGIGKRMRGAGLAGLGLLAGCGQAPPVALGTLEWDRITVPAPAAEVISSVEVREGQQVKAGAVLMQLDSARGDAQFAAAQADTARAQAQLEERGSARARNRSRRPRRSWPRCERSPPRPARTTVGCSRWHASA